MFVAVDVCPSYRGVAALVAFTSEHQLGTIASWHFLTATLASLRAVWQAYDIEVAAPPAAASSSTPSRFSSSARPAQSGTSPRRWTDHAAAGTADLPAGQLATGDAGTDLVTRQLER